MTNITHTDTSKTLTLASYSYGYNNANELTTYQDNSNSMLSYSYDADGELTGASGMLNGSSYSVSYSYDANGNRNMSGYTTGTGNELTSDGVNNYTYDNEGNTLTQTNIATGSVTYYTWDYRNRLTEVQVKDSHGTLLNDEQFTYDVNNNRIGVSLNGVQQLYTVYDGSNPYMDFNGSGTLTERYLTNPDSLSEFFGQVNASGTPQWFLTDNLGSIRQVVSTSGTSADAITYDPYGGLVTQTNAANAPRFGYAGGEQDAFLGIYRFNERWYNPASGRWLNEDPLALKPDSDPYRYAGNDPVNVTDPTGLDSSKVNFEGLDGFPFEGRSGREYFDKYIKSKYGVYCRNIYNLGCLGLAKIRLGILKNSPTPNGLKGGTPFNLFTPDTIAKWKVKCFNNYQSAADYSNSIRGKETVILAAQFDDFIITVDGNSELGKNEIDPIIIPTVGSGNYATLRYDAIRKSWYWEFMGTGVNGDDFNVKHRPFRPGKQQLGLPSDNKYTVYCVFTIP